jgi:AcrR family transcriptional regulator
LAVAEAALVELGYEATTLNLIAERACVSKRTIYAKYGDKKGLLGAVLQRMGAGTFGPELLVEDGLPLIDGLRWRAERVLRNNLRPGSIAITAIALRESKRFPEFLVTMYAAKRAYQQDPMQLYFERFRDRGIIRDVDCGELASMFFWMLSEDMVHTVATGVSADGSDEAIGRKASLVADIIAGAIIRSDRHATAGTLP